MIGIDLRCGIAHDMLVHMRSATVDLAIVDPPWIFDQRFGASAATDHYDGMTYAEILADLELLRPICKRILVWFSNAHLGPFVWDMVRAGWPPPVTGGSWDKGPVKYGQGYHAAGRTEPWLLWAAGDVGHNDREVLLETGCSEPAKVHSMKPVSYQNRMVRRWVPPGGLVVDPYAGFGTVAKAVQQAGEGRRYMGREKSDRRHADACVWLGLTAADVVG